MQENQSQRAEAPMKKNVKNHRARFIIKQNDLLVHKDGYPPPVPSWDKWVDDTIFEDTFWDKGVDDTISEDTF